MEKLKFDLDAYEMFPINLETLLSVSCKIFKKIIIIPCKILLKIIFNLMYTMHFSDNNNYCQLSSFVQPIKFNIIIINIIFRIIFYMLEIYLIYVIYIILIIIIRQSK